MLLKNKTVKQVKGSFFVPLPMERIGIKETKKNDHGSIELLDNGNLQIYPIPQPGQGSKGIGTDNRPFEGDVPIVKDTQPSNLTFLQWTKRVITEHPGILEHMLKSSDQLDKVIAKRIIQTASGRD